MKKTILLFCLFLLSGMLFPQSRFNGLDMNMGSLFRLYRWHIMDLIRFEKDLKITIQDLGWRRGGRYLAQKSDIASVCFWYQTEPHAKFPKLPDWRELEIY